MSFEPRHGKVRQGRHIDLKPGTRPAGGSRASRRDLSTLRPDSLPSQPGPHRLRGSSIRRLGVRSAGPSPSLSVVSSIDVFDYLAGYQDVPELTVRVRECRSRSSPACSCLDRRAAAAPLSGRGNALPISGPASWPAANRTAPRQVQGDRWALAAGLRVITQRDHEPRTIRTSVPTPRRAARTWGGGSWPAPRCAVDHDPALGIAAPGGLDQHPPGRP
jgi:hypothetical protein